MKSEQILSVILEEYKTLRAQVVSDLDRQYSLTNWGISSAALLVIGLAGGWERLQSHPFIVLFIIMIVLPVIFTAYAIAWSHIVRSTIRAGKYLYEIEEKLQKSCTPEAIREFFNLSPSDDISKFSYILGWEHRLRPAGRHSLVRPALMIVQISLAGLYLSCVVVGSLVFSRSFHLSFYSSEIRRFFTASGLAWAIVWLFAASYLARAGKVGELDSQPLTTTRKINLNLPNILTVLRLLLLAPAIILTQSRPLFSIGLIVVALATDYLDGSIARRTSKVTKLGALLDPLVDKAFVSSFIILLWYKGVFGSIIVAVILLRELLVEVLRQTAGTWKQVIPINNWGRLKLVLQDISIIVGVVALYVQVYYVGVTANVLLWLAFFASLPGVVIVLRYFRKVRRAGAQISELTGFTGTRNDTQGSVRE